MQTRLTTFLIAIAYPACAAAAPRPVASPGAGIDILDHRVELTPDFQHQSLSGRDQIRFRVLQDRLREIAFSDNSLLIESAQLNGHPAAVSRQKDALVFSSAIPLRRGHTATLSVLYHGKPARGVTFTDRSVFTSYWACDWMICSQDTPSDKASIEISLSLPPGLKSLAVGTLRSVKADASGRIVHRWRETRPYSSYLYGFAAGPFVERVERQPGFELAYLNATGSAQDMDALFGTTAEMVRFFEEKAGIPLPARRYSQLLVPGDEAQEAATYSLIGRSQIEPILKAPQNDWVLIHELAHQWWGNLITCKSWNHFWLNEGVAVFMTAAWKEHKFGRAAYEAELDVARSRVARVRETGEDRPLAYSGPYPSLGARRAIQYSKGALFLDHLRTSLGDSAFWAGLRLYTRSNSGGTVESRDLQRAFEKASGRDLTAMFNDWVYGSGT